MLANRIFFFTFSLLLILSSCKIQKDYFPHNEGKQVFYDVYFKDKDNKKSYFKQSYYFLPKIDNSIPVLKNDGEVIFYVFSKTGILKKTTNDFLLDQQNFLKNGDSEMLLAFPIKKDTQWETEDKTTIQMKLGYDRFYDTNLPFNLKNKIDGINETISINGNKIENCIKVSGYGKTSYYPDPTLGNINIEIFTTTWFAKDFGLVKYVREEKSDSATMGKIIYEKTMLIDN